MRRLTADRIAACRQSHATIRLARLCPHHGGCSVSLSSPAPLPARSQRLLWGIVDKVKAANAKGYKKVEEKRGRIEAEARTLRTRQLQILLSDRKPAEVATPLQLTDAAASQPFLLPTAPCNCINLLREAVSLPQQLQGRISLLHVAFNAHALQLGHQWIMAARKADVESASQPLPSSSPTAAAASSPSSPPSSPSSSSSSWHLPLQTLQLSLIANSLIRRWFGHRTVAALRASTPPELLESTLSVLDDAAMTAIQERDAVLQLRQQEMLGFLFLTDSRARIRWRAWGEMQGDDLHTMTAVIAQLKTEERDAERKEERKKEAAADKERRRLGLAYAWRQTAAAAPQQRPSGSQERPPANTDSEELAEQQHGQRRQSAVLAAAVES